MAYPNMPTAPGPSSGIRMGYFIKNVAGTLTAALARVKAVTATDAHGYLAVCTHIEGEAYIDSQMSEAPVVAVGMSDGTNIRAMRANQQGTCYASAARTASPTAMADTANYNAKGVIVVIDCTAITATPSVVFTIQGKDSLSGKYYTVLESAAIVGTGTTVLRVHPGLTAAANLVANDFLPSVWRVLSTHGDADSITYSVGYTLSI